MNKIESAAVEQLRAAAANIEASLGVSNVAMMLVVQDNLGRPAKEVTDQVRRMLADETMVQCRGNQSKAAEILQLNRGTLRRVLKG